jgi:hypothetical protein
MSGATRKYRHIPPDAGPAAQEIPAAASPEIPAGPEIPGVERVTLKWVTLAGPDYGLAVVDPTTGANYTHERTPVRNPPSAWVVSAIERGILVEV